MHNQGGLIQSCIVYVLIVAQLSSTCISGSYSVSDHGEWLGQEHIAWESVCEPEARGNVRVGSIGSVLGIDREYTSAGSSFRVPTSFLRRASSTLFAIAFPCHRHALPCCQVSVHASYSGTGERQDHD